MVKGKIKFFNRKKGYGFITPDKGEKDVFFHQNKVVIEEEEEEVYLNMDDKVTYNLIEGRKGLEANNVVVTEKAPYAEINKFSKIYRHPSFEGKRRVDFKGRRKGRKKS